MCLLNKVFYKKILEELSKRDEDLMNLKKTIEEKSIDDKIIAFTMKKKCRIM